MIRINMNPAYLTEQLLEQGWDPQQIQTVYDRLYALVLNGEDDMDLSRRLNPAKRQTPAWEPSPFRGPASRVTPVRVRR